MPIHIDTPVPGVPFDPADFRIRGWMWLEEKQTEIAAVEACDADTLLGEATFAAFHERTDVNAKYGLPAGTRSGFEFPARHPAAVNESFQLTIRARLRDGSHTPPLFTRLLAPPPPERHPFKMLCANLGAGACGLEIGAHTHPVAELSPFYADATANFAGTAGRVDFLADARALPLADDTLDYLCSSHVLEHLPDPIAALHEWHRVLRPGGWLYLVVPDKRYTFDEPRAITGTAHLLRNFHEGTNAAEAAAHIDEFIFQTDWSMLSPHTPPAEWPRHQAAARERLLQQLEQGEPIDIHFHTFTPASLDDVLRAAGFIDGDNPRFHVRSRAERYPPGRDDGIGLLLQKTGEPTRPVRPLETFRLTRNRVPASNGNLGLPLVCPISLNPLHLETDSMRGRTLVAAGAQLRYHFDSGRPCLLPPAGETPLRPWGARGWHSAKSAAAPSTSISTETIMRSHLDEPAPSSTVDPLCFLVRGWLWLEAVHADLAAVEAWSGETLIGSTRALYVRPDVTNALGLPNDALTGFELFAHASAAKPGASLNLHVCALLRDGTRTPPLARTTVGTIARDYRENHFGVLLDQRTTAIQREENIFASGPSQSEGSPELAALLRRYLGPPPLRVIDIGCGLGSYGRGLLADGYEWLGAEIDPADCAALARQGLPHWQVDGRTLPFTDGAFDAALCLEVLEHIDEPRAFLREIHRVAPRQLIVSVPNCELLGYLWDHLATPWHMLESTHVNYFTRWSLGALLREFYPHVELRFHTPYPLRSPDGTPLHYNLLAVASA